MLRQLMITGAPGSPMMASILCPSLNACRARPLVFSVCYVQALHFWRLGWFQAAERPLRPGAMLIVLSARIHASLPGPG